MLQLINKEIAYGEVLKLVRKFGTADPYRICKELDIEILEMDLGDTTLGQRVTNRRCSVILVEETLSDAWKRFVIAHELGHCRLHKGFSTAFYRQTNAYKMINWIEVEANLFALELLKEGIDDNGSLSKYEVIEYLGLPHDLEYFLK